jgi:hypothetical protein
MTFLEEDSFEEFWRNGFWPGRRPSFFTFDCTGKSERYASVEGLRT